MPQDQSGVNILWSLKDLRESNAFRGLTKTALLVLFDFYAKRRTKGTGKRAKMINNGELVYTYKEAEKRGISRASFQRALTQLVERGFIDVTFTGAGLYKSASLYALSDRWHAWGTDAFRTAVRNPHGRNKHHGFQSKPEPPCTHGTIKNVSNNDNGVDRQNSHSVSNNDNGSVFAITKNDN